MNKRKRYAWDVAKQAAKRRKNNVRKPRIVPGFTRTGGAYSRAYRANPSRALTLGVPVEKKFYDSSWGPTTLAGTSTIVSTFLAIAQGTTEVTRVGGKINVCNINFRGEILGLNSTDGAPEVVRCIWLWDKQANGAAPTATDILAADHINAFLNMDNTERFQIVKDKMYTIDTNCYDTVGDVIFSNSKIVKLNYKCSVPIHYSSTTGAITEIKSNNFIFLFVAIGAKAAIRYRVRVKFTDA